MLTRKRKRELEAAKESKDLPDAASKPSKETKSRHSDDADLKLPANYKLMGKYGGWIKYSKGFRPLVKGGKPGECKFEEIKQKSRVITTNEGVNSLIDDVIRYSFIGCKVSLYLDI